MYEFTLALLNWNTRTHAHTHTHSQQPVEPSLAYPAGQSPHLKDPTVLMHVRLLSQPPLLLAHSSTSECAGLYVCVCVCVCVFVCTCACASQQQHRAWHMANASETPSLTCALQLAAQRSTFATLQRRRTAAALLLITSLALESARRVGSRGQLERSGGLARVAGTALHASGECLVCRAFHLCNKQHSSQTA